MVTVLLEEQATEATVDNVVGESSQEEVSSENSSLHVERVLDV